MHFNGQNRKKWRKRTPIICVLQLFLGTPWAEKMTFSQKNARVWFDDTYPLNQWHVLSGKILVSPLEQFVKHHFGSADMCPSVAHKSRHDTWPAFNGGGPRPLKEVLLKNILEDQCLEAPGQPPGTSMNWRNMLPKVKMKVKQGQFSWTLPENASKWP